MLEEVERVGWGDLPLWSPNLNAYAERFVRSIKGESLSRVIPIGERHLRQFTEEFAEHYHVERDHHGSGNRLVEGRASEEPVARLECRKRLRGLLRSYHAGAWAQVRPVRAIPGTPPCPRQRQLLRAQRRHRACRAPRLVRSPEHLRIT